MKSIWTIVIVVVVLIIVGYGGYRLYHHYTYKAMQPAEMTHPQTQAMMPKTGKTVNTVYKMSSTSAGTVLTDSKGMTLYTYAKDSSGVSNCSGACLKAWPAFTAPSTTKNLPPNVTVVKRTDGTMQYAWNGMPLYYFQGDTKAGDVNGNGVGGVWSVVK